MGKQLVIVGADFSAVAIGTAKVLVSISAAIVPPTTPQYSGMAPTGVVVTATWDDQSTSTVSGWTASPAVWGEAGVQQSITISYTRGGVTQTSSITATPQSGGGTMYTVSANITDGNAASVQVASGGTATLTVVPDSGHVNPTSVTISSGTATSATISGATITVTNVTSDVVLAATCPSGAGTLTWYISAPTSAGSSSAGNNSNGWALTETATSSYSAMVGVPINRFGVWVSNDQVIGQTVYFAVYDIVSKTKISEQSVVITSSMLNNLFLTIPITTVTLTSSQALFFQPSDKVNMASQSWAIKFGNSSKPVGFLSRVPNDISGTATSFRFNSSVYLNFGYGYYG